MSKDISISQDYFEAQDENLSTGDIGGGTISV
jgi:hypothetical protein